MPTPNWATRSGAISRRTSSNCAVPPAGTTGEEHWRYRETQGRLAMFKNGEFLGSQVIKLNPGKNVYTYRQSLEQSGIHVYQAAIEVEGDTIEVWHNTVASDIDFSPLFHDDAEVKLFSQKFDLVSGSTVNSSP